MSVHKLRSAYDARPMGYKRFMRSHLLGTKLAMLSAGWALMACSGDPQPGGSTDANGGAFGQTGGATSGGAFASGASGGGSSGGTTAVGGGSSGGLPATGGVGAQGSGGGAGGSPSGGGGVGAGGSADGGTASGGDSGGRPSGGSGGSGGGASGGAASGGAEAGGSGGSVEAFVLSSPGWDVVENEDCTDTMPDTCPLYPEDNTSFGANVSPEMSWGPGPEGTESYAIVLEDLSNGFVHWAIWDIPAAVTSLPAELPGGAPIDVAGGALQAGFSSLGDAYFGSGACEHVYEHRLYALGVSALSGSPMSGATAKTAITGSGAVLAETFVRLQSRDYCP